MGGCFRKLIAAFALAAAAEFVGAPVSASPFYSGTIQGAFSDPVLAGFLIDTAQQPQFQDNTTTAVYSIQNTGASAELVEGDDFSGNGAPSTITFVGNSFSNIGPGQEFDLGTITYFNGTSFITSLIFGATLTLFVAEDPTITPAIANVDITTTINGGVSPVLDADYLSFPPPLNVSFHVYEGAGATAIVRGMIVGDPQLVLTSLALAPGQDANGFLVPEPATLVLLGVGLAGLTASRRRKPT